MSRKDLPKYLYAKKGNGTADTFAGLSGKTKPVVVYAVRAKNANYHICVKLEWKNDSKVLDETRCSNYVIFNKAATKYDALVRFVGVKKNREVWRIFNVALITSVYDIKNKRELLREPRSQTNFEREVVDDLIANPRSLSTAITLDLDALDYSEQLAHELHHHFGEENYDWNLDFIDVAAVSRRLQENAKTLVRKMSQKFHRCIPDKQSGCWLSPGLATYRTVARWKYDGFSPKDLFSHDGEGMERHVVRHHPIRCELLIEKNHCRCCRPSHLCYGSGMANTRDMQLRQAVANVLILFSKTDSRIKLIEMVDIFAGLLRYPEANVI